MFCPAWWVSIKFSTFNQGCATTFMRSPLWVIKLVMKLLISISALCILISCGSTTNVEQDESKNQLHECLTSELSNYYSKEDLILELLEDEGIIDDSKESYALLCTKMFSENIGHFEISEDDRKTLDFMDTFGPHASISQCAELAKSDSALTQNQVQYYNWFYDSAISGSMDTDALSEIINNMTEEEFNGAEIRNTTLFFCGQEIIRNHFFH